MSHGSNRYQRVLERIKREDPDLYAASLEVDQSLLDLNLQRTVNERLAITTSMTKALSGLKHW